LGVCSNFDLPKCGWGGGGEPRFGGGKDSKKNGGKKNLEGFGTPAQTPNLLNLKKFLGANFFP